MFESLKLNWRMSKAIAEKAFETLKKDESGEAPVKALVLIFIVAVLAGSLLPTGINSLVTGKNQSGTWSSSESATYGIIAIMIIIAVILLIVRMATE